MNLAWGLSLFICSLFCSLSKPLKQTQKKSTCWNFFHNETSISTNLIIQNLSRNNDPKRKKSYSLLEIHQMMIHTIHESMLHNFKYNFIANTGPIHRIRADGRNCFYPRANLWKRRSSRLSVEGLPCWRRPVINGRIAETWQWFIDLTSWRRSRVTEITAERFLLSWADRPRETSLFSLDVRAV